MMKDWTENPTWSDAKKDWEKSANNSKVEMSLGREYPLNKLGNFHYNKTNKYKTTKPTRTKQKNWKYQTTTNQEFLANTKQQN